MLEHFGTSHSHELGLTPVALIECNETGVGNNNYTELIKRILWNIIAADNLKEFVYK